jgi:hypothetical protein
LYKLTVGCCLANELGGLLTNLCHVPPVQAFVDASFDNITSTDHALSLLAQFSAILQRDALKQELESKYQVRSAIQS